MRSKLGMSEAAAEGVRLIPATDEKKSAEMQAAAKNVFLCGNIN
jgi:hypothetical protein